MLNHDRFVYEALKLLVLRKQLVLFSLDLRFGVDLEILGKTKLTDEEIKRNVSGIKL